MNAILLAVVVWVGLNMPADAQEFLSSAGTLNVSTVATGLEHPWGMEFLPDGRMLVTERPGRLRIVSKEGVLSKPLQGLPKVYAEGQGAERARRSAWWSG